MSTLADRIFEEFKEHSVSEFFRKNAAMLGYTGKIRSLTTIIHEGVTNSIDAAEEAGILPRIYVAIRNASEDLDHYIVVIEDNATGIPEEHIASVFGKMLAGTKLHRYMQQRGQQGIGISGATMFAQMTSGKPARVITSTGNGEIVEAEVMIDVTKNEGKLTSFKKRRGKWRGTRVEFEVKDVTYVRSRYGPFNYLRMTAIANPHVRIRFDEPDGVVTIFENAVTEIPKPPKPMKPHPWGMMADDLLRLAKQTKAKKLISFLTTELARVSHARAKEVCRMAGIGENKHPSSLSWEDAEKLIKAFKQVKLLAPPSEGLRPIGAENIISGMRQVLKPEFVHAVTRPPKVYRGGVPFLVEIGIAYGGEAGKRAADEAGEEQGIELIRFANRAPLIFDQGACAITTAMRSIDWKRYGIDPNSSPVTLFVNVVSAYVPYTSAGKQSIAEEPEIVAELRAAMMEVARELRLFLNRKIKMKERRERAMVFERYLPIIAQKAARLARAEVPAIDKLLKRIAGGTDGEEQ
jgi:DNA topoisomerase-6 subunit B